MRANVHNIRKRQGLTLRQLADQMKIINWPLSHIALSEIERGARRADADDIAALATALDVTIADLFGEPAVVIAREFAFREFAKIIEEAKRLDPQATEAALKVVSDGDD